MSAAEVISGPSVSGVFLWIPSSRLWAWPEPQGTCNPLFTHRHHLLPGLGPARPSVTHSSCIWFSACEIFGLPKGSPLWLQISHKALVPPGRWQPWHCRGQDLFHPEATALVKTFVIYHFFSNVQNVSILWDRRSDNGTERRYGVNKASAGLGTLKRCRKEESHVTLRVEFGWTSPRCSHWMRKPPLESSWIINSCRAGEMHDQQLFLKCSGQSNKWAFHRRNLTYVHATTLLPVVTLTYNHSAFQLYVQRADSQNINRHIHSKSFV